MKLKNLMIKHRGSNGALFVDWDTCKPNGNLKILVAKPDTLQRYSTAHEESMGLLFTERTEIAKIA